MDGDLDTCQLVLEISCNEDKINYSDVPEFTYAYNGDTWYFWLIIARSMSGFIFFVFVYRTKELFEVHPMNLIMYSILAESIGMIFFAM